MDIIPPWLPEITESAVGKKSIQWQQPDCGLSAAHRFSVTLEDKTKVFVKAAADEQTAGWLRTEHLVLSSLKGIFTPRILHWIDMPGQHPVLIMQDLTHAYWPASHQGVTWRPGDVELLFDVLRQLSNTAVPPSLPAMTNNYYGIWEKIAADPQHFLKLEICSEHWLTNAIDLLIKAESELDETGNCLVHGDVRSDNICFFDGRVIFVDWSHAARGSASHDLATLLPTLHLEGGPVPYEIMPGGAGHAARQSAMQFARLTRDQHMPDWLQRVFKKLIAINLEWAAQCLQLEKPDGIDWKTY